VITGARFVELFNAGATPVDLTGYRIKVYGNGSTALSHAASLLAETVAPCSTFLVVNDEVAFVGEYPNVSVADAAGHSTGGINGNGDDVCELTDGTNALAVCGVLGTDSPGQPWEYTDSISTRSASFVAGTTTFDVAQWTITADVACVGGGDSPGTR